MRPILCSSFVSLDGVINHMERWHFDDIDAESDALVLDQLRASDALLMGRHTYEVYSQAWPDRDDPYADLINAIPKYVVSSTLTNPTWNNTTVLSGDPMQSVRDLKESPGSRILMHGYGPLAKALVGNGLLDELSFWIHPVLAGIGSGEDLLLQHGLDRTLRLTGTTVLASGVVLLTYQTNLAQSNDVDSGTHQTGFTVTEIATAPPEVVFAYFTRPDLLARWFVVDGFTTPADRISLDPRPGGHIKGTMVSDDGATEVPFQARYGRLDPPHLAQYLFTGPTETVTLTLQDLGDGQTHISYENRGYTTVGNGHAIRGAAAMLHALALDVQTRSSHAQPVSTGASRHNRTTRH